MRGEQVVCFEGDLREEEGLEVPVLLPRPRLSARLSHFCIPILFCLLVCKHTHAYLTCIFFCVRFYSFIRTYTLINTYIDTYLHRHVYAYTHIYIYCKYIPLCKTLKLFMNTFKHTYTHVYSVLNIIHTFIDRHVYLACIFCVRLYDRVIQPHYI